MFDERWNAPRAALESLLLPVHAADRLTASRWFSHIEPGNTPSSNVEAHDLPLQRWYRFKEAFSPRFVFSAIASLDKRPVASIDPFGGSGTTALASQFLGIRPTTIEVNPFLADLIEAKLCRYDIRKLVREFAKVTAAAKDRRSGAIGLLEAAPPTFIEPGVNNRWIFGRAVAKRFLAIRQAIDDLATSENKRLFRILLGSIAIRLSNVVISGKGRRYRSGWETRPVSASAVDKAFEEAITQAIQDISRFGERAEHQYMVLRGDSRELITSAPQAEFSLFSPPYPNSFDYTDIYNVELWLLGYLSSAADNRTLRNSTLRSHVQVKRSYTCETPDSPLLNKTMSALQRKRGLLWNKDIPGMVRAYFGDMAIILRGLDATMAPKADVMMVIGDSRYAGVHVDVAAICAEIAPALGFKVKGSRPIRAMRASVQQGGRHELSETLLHLQRRR